MGRTGAVHRTASRCGLFLWALTAAGLASAQAPSGLGQAVEAAWRLSVEATSARGQGLIAQAHSDAARAWWAAPPAIELSRRSPRGGEPEARTESEFLVAVPMLMPGQRSARMAAADSDEQLSRATLAVARWRIAGEVREAAWSIVARESEWSLSSRDAEALEALARDVERRVAAGDLARADALAARAEWLSAQAAAAEANQRLEAARANWASLVGQVDVPRQVEPVVTGELRHPLLERVALATARARKQSDLIRAERQDPPELTLRYRRETTAAGLPAENSVGLGLRIPLGTDDRNRPREAGALAALDGALAEAERAEREVRRDIQSARQAAEVAEVALKADIERATLLRERASLVEKSFRAGQSALPELLRARLAAQQAEAAREARQSAVGLARARLNQAYGHTP